jgi:GH24 family phage-related lysozyme (muramidase)
MTKPNPALSWPIDYESGVLQIAEDEGCKLKAYRCIAGKWTCGWGETDGVTPTTVWTQEYADQRFCDSIAERVAAVKAACIVEPTPNQLAALTSFAYNYGGWRSSTALKAHNRGDYLAAANAMQSVDKFRNPATGKLEVSEGLRARRAREAALYLKSGEGAHPMPQAVEPEQPPVASTRVQAGTVAAGAGVLGALGEAKDALGPVGDTVGAAKGFLADTLGLPTQYVPYALLIGLGLFLAYHFLRQRREGVA